MSTLRPMNRLAVVESRLVVRAQRAYNGDFHRARLRKYIYRRGTSYDFRPADVHMQQLLGSSGRGQLARFTCMAVALIIPLVWRCAAGTRSCSTPTRCEVPPTDASYTGGYIVSSVRKFLHLYR